MLKSCLERPSGVQDCKTLHPRVKFLKFPVIISCKYLYLNILCWNIHTYIKSNTITRPEKKMSSRLPFSDSRDLSRGNHVQPFFFVFLSFFRAAPMAYGGSRARGPIGATAAGLRHSHSNTGMFSFLIDVSSFFLSHHFSVKWFYFNSWFSVLDVALHLLLWKMRSYFLTSIRLFFFVFCLF